MGQINLIKGTFTRFFILGILLSSSYSASAPQSKSLRKSFYGWKSISGSCRNQRHEIFMQRSSEPVKFKTNEQCRVISGIWLDYYTADSYYWAEDVTIDHVVSLKYAYDHGAKAWPKNKRVLFYNDEENLVLTGRKINSTKNHYAPDEWLPDTLKAQCKYLEKWNHIAEKYHLDVEADIVVVNKKMASKCTPGETRTPDHLVRSQALYPTELRAQ